MSCNINEQNFEAIFANICDDKNNKIYLIKDTPIIEEIHNNQDLINKITSNYKKINYINYYLFENQTNPHQPADQSSTPTQLNEVSYPPASGAPQSADQSSTPTQLTKVSDPTASGAHQRSGQSSESDEDNDDEAESDEDTDDEAESDEDNDDSSSDALSSSSLSSGLSFLESGSSSESE